MLWKAWSDALAEATRDKRTIAVLVQAAGCSFCTKIKPELAQLAGGGDLHWVKLDRSDDAARKLLFWSRRKKLEPQLFLVFDPNNPFESPPANLIGYHDAWRIDAWLKYEQAQREKDIRFQAGQVDPHGIGMEVNATQVKED